MCVYSGINSVPPRERKPLVLAIVGPAGSGKDTIASWLSEHEGYHQVVSYTTRPMREGEHQGREHHFVEEFPEVEHFACHTEYGGYHYWVNTEQILPYPVSVYVVDEVGLLQLCDIELEGVIRLLALYVDRDEALRLQSGVSQERIDRDKARQTLPLSRYDFVIKNNKSVKALTHKLREVVDKVNERRIAE